MVRFWLALVLFTGSASAQSRVELLERVAQHYSKADSFDVKGTALAPLPGTSWESGYSFEAQGVQPKLLPPSLNATSMKDLEIIGQGGPIKKRVDAHAVDPFPAKSFSVMESFGDYQRLTQRLLNAEEAGAETLTVDGRTHRCEIIDATYDTSPDFLPHTRIAHRRFWIDPKELVVLREKRSFDGLDWTADITSYSFDRPVSAETVNALQSMANQAKDRPYWVGRSVPDLTLQQLSGPPIRLADLKGKPVLLDFWGSYCGPCRAATQHAQELAERFRSSGLIVITLTQDDATTARLWANHNHITLPVVLDHDEAAFKAFDASEVPITIFANADGKIAHYWTSYVDPQAIDAFLTTALRANTAAVDDSSRAH